MDEVESAAFYHRRNEYDAVYAGSQKLASCNIFGIDSNYLDAYGFQITKGRGFSEKDFTANRKVVLLDKTTATALFPDGNVIGKIIEVKGEPFTVIGMMARKENSQPVINSMEDIIVMYPRMEAERSVFRIHCGRLFISTMNRRIWLSARQAQMR